MADLFVAWSWLTQYFDALYYPGVYWYVLLSAVLLAVLSFWLLVRGRHTFSLKASFYYLFPKSIYRHPSAILDYKYFLSSPIIGSFLFRPALAIATTTIVYDLLAATLTAIFGASEVSAPAANPHVIHIAAFTLLTALAADFMFYLHHVALHHVSFLWSFHKVHHSAEVLTPITDGRAHPLEIYTYATFTGVGVGAIQALFGHFVGLSATVAAVAGINAVIFTIYLLGYPLRHSHVWVDFGPIFDRIVISPAQHQIHHSVAQCHWDKNFGRFFSLWDWMFGTLYVPKRRESLTFGLSGKAGANYKTVTQLYFQPFVDAAKSPVTFCVAVVLALFIGYTFIQRVLERFIG